MPSQVTTLTGLALISSVLAIGAPGVSDAFTQTIASSPAAPPSAKADRLSAPKVVPMVSVAVVQVSGSRGADVTMRDVAGTVVYWSEQTARTTKLTKSVALAPPESGRETGVARLAPDPAAQRPRRVPAGCERLISSLARSSAVTQLARCIT